MNTDIETGEGFHITDENAALWYLHKLANIEAEARRIRQQAERMITALNTESEGLKRVYQGELENWTREELKRKGNRRKTLHTLQGTLRFRHVPARLSIGEDTAALRYATESLRACIITKEELNRAAYLEEAQYRLDTTGELLAGVDITPEKESFTVSFAKEEN